MRAYPFVPFGGGDLREVSSSRRVCCWFACVRVRAAVHFCGLRLIFVCIVCVRFQVNHALIQRNRTRATRARVVCNLTHTHTHTSFAVQVGFCACVQVCVWADGEVKTVRPRQQQHYAQRTAQHCSTKRTRTHTRKHTHTRHATTKFSHSNSRADPPANNTRPRRIHNCVPSSRGRRHASARRV